MKQRRYIMLFLLLLLLVTGCGQKKGIESAQGEREAGQQNQVSLVGLILTCPEAEENAELIRQFEELTDELGADLMVRMPEVTMEEAEAARELEGHFILYDVDPIEHQMLYVNEMVAADADVIAIHANHPESLGGVLSSARSVGVQICAFEQEVGEKCFDIYVPAGEAAEAVKELLQGETEFDS